MQEHTAISVDTGPAAVRLIVGNAPPPPPPAAAATLFPPPPPPPAVLPPAGNATSDLAAQLGELLDEWMPTVRERRGGRGDVRCRGAGAGARAEWWEGSAG